MAALPCPKTQTLGTGVRIHTLGWLFWGSVWGGSPSWPVPDWSRVEPKKTADRRTDVPTCGSRSKGPSFRRGLRRPFLRWKTGLTEWVEVLRRTSIPVADRWRIRGESAAEELGSVRNAHDAHDAQSGSLQLNIGENVASRDALNLPCPKQTPYNALCLPLCATCHMPGQPSAEDSGPRPFPWRTLLRSLFGGGSMG